MATTYFSYCNPLRFHKRSGEDIDFEDNYPRPDLEKYRESSQRGNHATSNLYPVFPVDSTISIQVSETSSITYHAVLNYPFGTGGFNMDISNITPTGWVSGNIFKLTLDPNKLIAGNIYMVAIYSTSTGWFLSDEFMAVDPSIKKDTVKIQCYDSDNRFNGVFTDGTDWIWQPTKYLSGKYNIGEPGNEYSIFNQSNGIPVKVDANPTRTRIIDLAEMSKHEAEILNSIFSCDNIIVNSEEVQNVDGIEWNYIDNTDICDPVIKVTLIDNDNSNKFS